MIRLLPLVFPAIRSPAPQTARLPWTLGNLFSNDRILPFGIFKAMVILLKSPSALAADVAFALRSDSSWNIFGLRNKFDTVQLFQPEDQQPVPVAWLSSVPSAVVNAVSPAVSTTHVWLCIVGCFSLFGIQTSTSGLPRESGFLIYPYEFRAFGGRPVHALPNPIR